LRRAYKVTREDAASVVRRLLSAKELVLQEADAVRRALARLTTESDFADVLISELGILAGCDRTATLDKRASRIRGMKLVP
jgi:predicted nucleic-acid-binding protein